MTEQELREKIINTIKENGVYNGKSMHRDYYVVNDEELADALIAANIGDVCEWKHRTELAEKMYSTLRDIQVEKRRCGIPIGINCLVENEDCAKCMDIYYVIEAEKELQEERKDD